MVIILTCCLFCRLLNREKEDQVLCRQRKPCQLQRSCPNNQPDSPCYQRALASTWLSIFINILLYLRGIILTTKRKVYVESFLPYRTCIEIRQNDEPINLWETTSCWHMQGTYILCHGGFRMPVL